MLAVELRSHPQLSPPIGKLSHYLSHRRVQLCRHRRARVQADLHGLDLGTPKDDISRQHSPEAKISVRLPSSCFTITSPLTEKVAGQ
jgi:hypothetical protein